MLLSPVVEAVVAMDLKECCRAGALFRPASLFCPTQKELGKTGLNELLEGQLPRLAFQMFKRHSRILEHAPGRNAL